MGFTILIFFGPLILGVMLLEFLMVWLSGALNVVVTVMLVANVIFLLFLLFLRAKWKAAGRMEKDFIDTYQGWRHYGLLGVKLLLTWGTVWEAVVVGSCVLLLLFRPWNAMLPG